MLHEFGCFFTAYTGHFNFFHCLCKYIALQRIRRNGKIQFARYLQFREDADHRYGFSRIRGVASRGAFQANNCRRVTIAGF